MKMNNSLVEANGPNFGKQWKKAIKKISLGLCILGVLGLVAGCGSDSAGGTTNKDVLKIGVTNFADTLEPTENYFAWVVMRYGIGETLAKFDEKMNTQPWLAKSWELAPDQLTWTFHIDERAKFSNGRPVTAEAVKQSIERVFQKTKRAATFFTYSSITANGQDLVIKTEKPTPNMQGLLSDPLFLIVDTQAEKEGRNFGKEGPIGTGPYAVKSFTKDRTVVVRNENYWDGAVPFKEVEIPSIDDPNTRAMALQSGDVDMAVNIAAGDMDLFRKNDKFHVDEISSLRVVLSRINQKGVLGDPRLRAALISGADRKTYAEVLMKGTFLPGKAPIPPSLDYGFDQLVDPNAYNPERAALLLSEAGWKDTDGDGILDKDGKPLAINLVTYNSRAELPMYAEALQADMRKLGVRIDINSVDYNLVDKIGIDGDYDLLFSNNATANTGDPGIFMGWYWRTNHNGDNPQNGSGYTNPLVDAKLDELSTEFDAAKRRQLIIDLQQIYMNDAASLFLGYPMTNIVSSTSLENAKMHPADYYWLTKDIKRVGQ